MLDRTGVRTGIVGLGNIGQFHADRLVELGADLAGGMDVSSTARDRFEHRYGVKTYDDHHALYETVDAVVITTPNKFHERYAVDALDRGIHVLVEKPLAHDLESAERIAAAARAADAVTMVGFNNRYANPVRILKRRIERGDLGAVVHVEANYVRRRGIPGRGSWFTRQDIAGGGALIDLGVHAIDLAMYLLSYPPVTSVSGVTRGEFGSRDEYAYLEMWGDDAGPGAFDVEDSVSAFVRCARNRSIALEIAWATNRPETHEFVVHGTEAAARFDLIDGELSFHSASSVGTDHLENTFVETRANDTHTDELRTFLDAIVTGRPLDDDVEWALTVQRIVAWIYQSSDRGKPICRDDIGSDHD